MTTANTKRIKVPKPLGVYNIPLYGGSVYLYDDIGKYQKASELFTGFSYEGDFEGVMGLTLATQQTTGTVFLVAVLDGSLSTLVHECAHVCLIVCESVGMEPTDSNGEPFCYLQGDMFKNLAGMLVKGLDNLK